MASELSPSSFELLEMTPNIRWTLGGRLESLKVAVPGDVRITEDCLEWIPGRTIDGQSGWWPDGDYAARAVGAFFKLANETQPEQIRDFARRYGVLGLSLDGLPSCGATHRLVGPPQLREPWQEWAVSWEPLMAYPYYAAGAKAMLILGTALKNTHPDQTVDPWQIFADAGLVANASDGIEVLNRTRYICEVWQRRLGMSWEEWWGKHQNAQMNLHSLDPAHVAFNFTLNRNLYGRYISDEEWAHAQRAKYARWLTDFWLSRAGLLPTVVWNESIPRLAISIGQPLDSWDEIQPPNSLFRLVVTHLVAVACGRPNTAQCSNCGQLYSSARKVREDQPHYCEVCRATAPSRRTQRSRVRKLKRDKAN